MDPTGVGDRKVDVRGLEPSRIADFQRIHGEAGGNGWCQCVAWWVPTWDGWGERTAAENRALREHLFREGQYDGFLLYVDDEPVGWMQVGAIGRLAKLWRSYRLDELPVTPADLAVSCVFLRPEFRGAGLLHRFLGGVVRELEAAGRASGRARQLLAFPRRGRHPDDDVWTGPEGVFPPAGFGSLRDGDLPVLGRPFSWAPAQPTRSDPSGSPTVVVFDLGGVLVEQTGLERLRELAPDRDASDLWRFWLASPAVRAFEGGRIDAGTFARQLVGELGVDLEPAVLATEIASWIRGPYPGAVELVRALRGQAHLACLSNTNELHWERMSVELDLYDTLDRRFLSFRTGLLKPDAEAFRYLLAALAAETGGRAERVLYLDDQPANVAAARALGIDARETLGIDAVRTELARAGFLPEP